ncbi:MAG: DUF2795 domain-containing protein [Mycobacteriales bacterium]
MSEDVASLTHGAPEESHAEEALLAEGAGEDQPTPTTFLGHREGSAGEGLSPDQIEARSTLARWLGRAVFPAVREQLIGAAIDAAAPAAVVDRLRELPSGREFRDVGDVWRATGEQSFPRA